MRGHSKTNLFRLCYSEKKEKPTAKSKCLELLPNFPIRKGRISIDSELPSKLTTDGSAKKERVVKANVSEFIEKYKQHFEMIYPSIGQLLTLFVLNSDAKEKQKSKKVSSKDLFLSPSVATCSLVTIDNHFSTRFGITCLHAVKTSPHSTELFTPDDYEKVCFFVKSENDVGGCAWKTHDFLETIWARQPIHSLTSKIMVDTFIERLEKNMSNDKTYLTKVYPCKDFLEMRKEFIIQNSKLSPVIEGKKYKHQLLDPEFRLQPIPSLDLMTFELPKAFETGYSTFLKETEHNNDFVYDEHSITFSAAKTQLGSTSQKKSFAYINIDLDAPAPITSGDLVALVGYQNVKVDPIATETDDLYRKSFKAKIAAFSPAEFLNENLSLGFCTASEVSETIFTFKGNTTEGSSGSPILDRELRLLGINFGCYYDYQTDESLRREKETKKKASRSQSIKSKVSSIKSSKLKDSKGRSTSQIKTTSVAKSKHTNDNAPEKSLFEFDIEIEEPGAKDHEDTLKNRNLAINVAHPILVAWLKKRKAELVKELKTKFSPKKDTVGNKLNYNPVKKFAKR